jgi:tetratricopeptide (TPR) repeat protein
VAACGGHPLALSVVAARAAADTANSLHAVVDELEDKHAALDALRLEDTADFRAVFALSYDHLPAALADAFRALTLHPGVGVDVRATAAMIGVKVHQARGTLGELVRCHLLERTSAGHYVLHALTHVFGLEQSQSHDPPEHCSSVVRALLNHQLHAASRADRLINDHRRPLPLEPCARPELLPPLADRAEALAWFTVEYDNVLATIATANAEHIHPYTWQLPWVISNYAYLTARWQDWIDTHVDAVAAAQHLGDRSAEARLLQSLARAHCESGAYRLSVKGYQAALGILDELGDVPGQANALNGIAGVRLRAGHPAEALDTGLEALGLYVSLGDDAAIAGTYSLLGRASQAVGSLTDAARYYRLAHDMYARTANHYGLAHVADCMAELELTADNHDRATEHLCRAIEMHQKVGNLTYAARSCRKLRSLLLRQGPPDARTEWLGTAITMLEKNRDVDAARILDLIAHR